MNTTNQFNKTAKTIVDLYNGKTFSDEKEPVNWLTNIISASINDAYQLGYRECEDALGQVIKELKNEKKEIVDALQRLIDKHGEEK